MDTPNRIVIVRCGHVLCRESAIWNLYRHAPVLMTLATLLSAGAAFGLHMLLGH